MAIFNKSGKITAGMQDANSGVNPLGERAYLPVDGTVFSYIDNLSPNQEVNTDWIEVGNFKSLGYIIQSTNSGTISAVEYSEDGQTVSATGLSRAYEGGNVLLQVYLTLKSKFFRMRFTNNNANTTSFYFECKLSTSVFQNTMASIFQPVTRTNVASITKSIIELDNGTGTYAQLTRNGTSLNVNVTNPSDVSGLAKEDGGVLAAILQRLGNGAQTVQIVDGNNQTRGIDALPFKVQFPANYTPPATPVTDNGGSLTVDGTVAVSNFPSNQNVTLQGTPTVNANVTFPTTQQVSVSNFPTSTEISNDSGNPIPVSGTVNVGNFPATQSISGNVGITGTPTVNIGTIPEVEIKNDTANPIPVSGTFYQATQPVSATSLPLPTGASTSALQTTGNTSLANIDADLGSPTDPVVIDASQTATITSLLKGILQKGIAPATASTFQDITLAANVAQTIPANINRKGVIVSSYNGTILIGVGYTATATRWSYRIVTNGSFDIPEHWAPLSISLLSTTASTATATLIT